MRATVTRIAFSVFTLCSVAPPAHAQPAHECADCHVGHTTGVALLGPNLTRDPSAENLCLSCHNGLGPGPEAAIHTNKPGSSFPAFSTTCLDCHTQHDALTTNLKLVRTSIDTPSAGVRTVVFDSLTGAGSLADDTYSAPWDGVCEVCHESTQYHRNDSSSPSAHNDGTRCTTCHPHAVSFAPQDCNACHTMGGAHATHTQRYSYSCDTCHFGHGSGTPTHNNGTPNVAFDPGGLATRNGGDFNTPTYTAGTKVCSDVYCHSNGVSADRGTDGTYTWGSLPFGAVSYAVTPGWDSGSINTCDACHPGQGNMTAPYYIYRRGPINATSDYPATGSHAPNRGAHYSNSQDFDGVPDNANDWLQVQCFWCHNANGADPINGDNLQGTYGTLLHVDGQTHFRPTQYANGGTMADGLSYSYDGSSAHCGNGKTCW